MIVRSTKTHFGKFINTGRHEEICKLIDEYTKVVQATIDLFWNDSNIPKFAPDKVYNKFKTKSFLSPALIQSATKQGLGIIKGTKKKFCQRQWMFDKLSKSGEDITFLERAIEKNPISKPIISDQDIIFDSRNLRLDENNHTSFDGWIKLSVYAGNSKKIQIPFKRNKHFNRLDSIGTRKNSVVLSKTGLKFIYEIQDYSKESGSVIGVDIGAASTISASDGFVSQKDIHGNDLSGIIKKMSKQKKGSNAFRRSQTHRKNFINWTINKLNLDNVKVLKRENIKDLRKGSKSSRFLSHWVYATIIGKLESKCQEQGVLVETISPTYTSRRCSNCGWTKDGNRSGKNFSCNSCGFSLDADFNAARNIAIVNPITFNKRSKYDIGNGFYWNNLEEESIVPL